MSGGTTSAPANKLETVKKALHDMLHEKSALTPLFEQAEKYTKLKREYLFLGVVAVLFLYLMVGYGAGLIVNLIGFVYPAYKSCKAIDSVDKDDDTQWLTYWVVYAVFGILEYFTDILLSWIPFYFLLKCIFLIWCMLPMASSGSMIIYHKVIKPFVKQHEKELDSAFNVAGGVMKDAAGKAFSAAKDAAGNVDLNKLQQLKEMGDALSDETSKKDD